MDRLETMGAFVAVAERQSFAQAARSLGISAPAVTRAIADLEDHLGIRLFQRTTRRVSLTDAGGRYLEQTRRILAAVTDAERSARAEVATPTGRLAVTAPVMFGRIHVAPLLQDVLARYPEIHGELVLVDRNVDLIEENIDVAVRIGALEDSSLIARAVGKVRRVLVASPKYLASQPRIRAPADLAHHALIQLTPLLPTGWHIGEVRITTRPKLSTNSPDAAIGYAVRGGGVAMALSYQVAEHVRAGRLAIVLPRHEPPAVPIQLVVPATRQLAASSRAFIDRVAEKADWSFVDL